jgi:hypothetical protein
MAKKAAKPAVDEDDVDIVIEGEEAPPTPANDAEPEEESEDEDDAESEDHDDEPEVKDADEDDESLIDEATREKRERRRLERHSKRQHAREKEERMRQRIEQQDRMLREQTERLAALERKDVSHDLSQLDQRIIQAANRSRQAEQALQKAIATGDGELHTQAMKVWYESSREAESLSNYKENLVKAAQQPAPIKADPLVKSLAEKWASTNNWYDPGNRDADSKVAYAISEAIAQEGLSPNDSSYWSELDARLKRYLPHRYEQTERQAKQKPRTPVAGSGRDSRSPSGREEFVLSRDRVEAIKQAGAWDDLAARKQMINAYREYDKKNR